jgi:glutamate-ammonia-ligase adenylyltransferase
MASEPVRAPLPTEPRAQLAQRIVSPASHSRFVQRIRRRYADELALLAPGLPDGAAIAELVGRLQAEGRTLAAALRIARQLTLERLAVLDVEEGAPLADITGAMTDLAETTLELALAQTLADQDARFGVPRDSEGKRIDFWIVGMGKLGARELNVSSDIDLVYVYESEGQTDGALTLAAVAAPREGAAGLGNGPAPGQTPGKISAHEYFAQVARGLYALIGEVTDDGFVFRVDLALRPNGNSGPTAVSLAMLEDYLQAHGREWERFAWLKSRVGAPRPSGASGRGQPR